MITKMRLFSICTEEKETLQGDESFDENEAASNARINHDVESILDEGDILEIKEPKRILTKSSSIANTEVKSRHFKRLELNINNNYPTNFVPSITPQAKEFPNKFQFLLG